MSGPEAGGAREDGPVAVWGGGVSGRAVGALLESLGRPFRLFDERGDSRGERDFAPAPGEFVLAVTSPGFAPGHPWRKRAAAAGLPVVGETAFAASLWPGDLLCVTGTNGKTTLVRLLEGALRAAGESARACGNIGRPLSALCLEDPGGTATAVCETSSFQLFDWERPECMAAIWTNFDRDHLDWHPSAAEYFAAKERIFAADPPSFAGPSVREWARRLGRRAPEGLRYVGPGDYRGPEGSRFARPPWDELYALAAAWWESTGRPASALAAAARALAPLPHRLEDLGSVGGIRFVDDSKATNPHAALAAVASREEPIRWLGGGSAKGEDLGAFASALAGKIASADTFGATGGALADQLAAAGCPVRSHGDLDEAFRSALARVVPGEVVLLSPGFASFDQFSGYAERGERFRALVAKLGTEDASPGASGLGGRRA